MAREKFLARLTPEERDRLEHLVRAGRSTAMMTPAWATGASASTGFTLSTPTLEDTGSNSITLDETFAAATTTHATTRAQAAPDPTEVPGNWPLIPSGLAAGDQFRLLLVTHQVGDATETDIAIYNSFVQGEINTNGH